MRPLVAPAVRHSRSPRAPGCCRATAERPILLTGLSVRRAHGFRHASPNDHQAWQDWVVRRGLALARPLPKVQLGVGSFTWPWAVGIRGYEPPKPLGARALLAKAAALGVKVVQFCDNLPLEDLDENELHLVETRARALGISVEVGTRGIESARLLRNLRLAARFHSPILRTVTDRGKHEPTPEEVVRTVRPLMPAFARAGVRLAIENHDRFDSVTLAWIVARLGTKFGGVCLDTVNSFGALEGPQVVVERLARYTVNLHLKDFRIERVGSMLGFAVRGAPAGRGRLDVPWLLRELKSRKRDVNAIIELWTPWEGSIGETVEMEDKWAGESVRNMRQYIRE